MRTIPCRPSIPTMKVTHIDPLKMLYDWINDRFFSRRYICFLAVAVAANVPPMPYHFKYDVNNLFLSAAHPKESNYDWYFGHEESSDGKVVTGKYDVYLIAVSFSGVMTSRFVQPMYSKPYAICVSTIETASLYSSLPSLSCQEYRKHLNHW